MKISAVRDAKNVSGILSVLSQLLQKLAILLSSDFYLIMVEQRISTVSLEKTRCGFEIQHVFTHQYKNFIVLQSIVWINILV